MLLPRVWYINDGINDLIRDFADNQTVYFLDISKTFLAADGELPKDIMPDLLHPNEEGYERWAKAMEPKIKELLGEK